MTDKAPTSSAALVQSINFGSRVAEDEADDLSSYFVRTETWRQVRDGEVDVVFAPKGSGKSALYSMLISEEDALFDDKVLLAPAENPTGTPAFASVGESDPSEDDLVKIWKLYFLVLISQELEAYSVRSPQTKELFEFLRDADLLPETLSKPSLLAMVREYVAQFLHHKSHETTVHVGPDGMPTAFTGKIEFAEPSVQNTRAGFVSIDYLLGLVETTLNGSGGYSLWLLLDRLDVAFASKPGLERKALRALFRAYSDLTPYKRIGLKIFLRNDIWEAISDEGFREASHLIREASITWDRDSLRQLVVRRLAQSERVLTHYSESAQSVVASPQSQEEFFYRVFPSKVDAGSGKSATLDWVLNRTQDGKGVTAPRELIHLMSEVRLAQLRRNDMGQPEPAPPALFSPRAFDAALPPVSNIRVQRTLYAEYVDSKPYIAALQGEKTEHNSLSLARIWSVQKDEASSVADRLVDIGFFQRKGPNFWVPFMYRPALALVQGAAPEIVR
ncbi:P-loop ATPase, Sll1717 family [Clavibacter michiganensis]|uniref:P-loop ATPase, Sll1717 family n=1 Tax=Clavibacter michiganensis TaxID=28447 RepID=UPI001056DA5D|nr:hypothetical protein [Clavibacter michiganensis]